MKKPKKLKKLEQLDLFGGERQDRPKARNIKLKPDINEPVPVPGMASFSGEGPPHKYCQDCHWFGSVSVRRPDNDTVEMASEACALWSSRMGHAAPLGKHHGIRHCAACKHFREAEETTRAFSIDSAGVLKER